MKLSDALILKAEWWITSSADVASDILERKIGDEMFEISASHMCESFLTSALWKLGNDASSYLSLFEAEYQKDIEEISIGIAEINYG